MRGLPGRIRLASVLLGALSVHACERADPALDAYAAIVAEEDARGALGFEAVEDAMDSEEPRVRAWAARALGRQEDPALLGQITAALDDDDPRVRAAAWFAAAQALYREPAMGRILDMVDGAGTETDPAVLGAMATVVGWSRSAEGDGASLSRAGEALAGLAERIDGSRGPGELGLARGLEALARTHGSNRDVRAAVERLATPLLASDGGVESPRVRTLALAALGAVGGASEAALVAAAEDADAEVRRTAFGLITRLGRGYREAVAGGLGDPSPRVRIGALAAWDRWVRPGTGCEAVFALARDENPNVALTAIDLLRRPCSDGAAQRSLLTEIIADTTSTWHRPAHALVALAGLAPEQTRQSVADFRTHPSAFARAWAARAAAEGADLESLQVLAGDDDPNVRTAALTGLLATRGGGAGPYLEALTVNDPQLVMTALGGLAPTNEDHTAAAVATLHRFTDRGMWTERDVRMALLDFLSASPHVTAAELQELATDFDPAVAERAATLLEERGESLPIDRAPTEPKTTPTARRLGILAGSQVVLEMAAGPETPTLGQVVIALRPDLAATNADRFARLVEGGVLNGLTLHRVVPNFVVQGGSPGANEYAGHGDYTRDEISAEGHWRGMVGLSTRGRDTGDGQIFFNLIDNARLDFNYTILGEVTRGMEVVDRLAEGAVIRDARLERRRAP